PHLRPGPDQLPALRGLHRGDRRRPARAAATANSSRRRRARPDRDAGAGRPVRRGTGRGAALGWLPGPGYPPPDRAWRRPVRTGRSPMTIKVVIADDQALVRGGFVVMVGAAPDMK